MDRRAIAVAIEIPIPRLYLWHAMVGRGDEKSDSIDYIDLLN